MAEMPTISTGGPGGRQEALTIRPWLSYPLRQTSKVSRVDTESSKTQRIVQPVSGDKRPLFAFRVGWRYLPYRLASPYVPYLASDALNLYSKVPTLGGRSERDLTVASKAQMALSRLQQCAGYLPELISVLQASNNGRATLHGRGEMEAMSSIRIARQ
jgi:hypothetical protein